ncbi:hypothetical protein DPMN_103107 [Dreissena polymorpha]|uniref:Uncharacterized protein n=1 Tax=Dreissena polymorpha TaxID=45954 RepID=A0A9D4H5D9_DREPO|nr:hypothetical protein DPMN_103107 [Dreissena polymorpha]
MEGKGGNIPLSSRDACQKRPFSDQTGMIGQSKGVTNIQNALCYIDRDRSKA